MIYTRYGTEVVVIGAEFETEADHRARNGQAFQLWVKVRRVAYPEFEGIDVLLSDLCADGGYEEIAAAIEAVAPGILQSAQ